MLLLAGMAVHGEEREITTSDRVKMYVFGSGG